MALVVPNVGEVKLLSYMLNIIAPPNTVLHLYSNNLTPSATSVYADCTEVSASGYAAVTLTSATWTVATSAGVATASYPEITFTFSTSATVYGYYVTDTSTNLLWLERFTAAPFQLPSSGGQILITSTISLNSCA
jgi:hypothetical protein